MEISWFLVEMNFILIQEFSLSFKYNDILIILDDGCLF